MKERVKENERIWLALLRKSIVAAVERGELKPAAEPEQLAFELNGLLLAANFSYILHGDAEAIRRARRAVDTRIDQLLA